MASTSPGSDAGIFEMARMRAEIESSFKAETIGDFVRRLARLHEDATAAVWFDSSVSITYRELDAAADRLASSLLLLGVRKGTHVALILPNVPAYQISWIALARLGAVAVPVNIGYTARELRFVLADSDAQFAIVDQACTDAIDAALSDLPLLAAERLIVHGAAGPRRIDWRALVTGGSQAFAAPSEVTPSDLLNLQYTSGTTGLPKGCMLPHDYFALFAHYTAQFRGCGGKVRNVLIWAPCYYVDPHWQFLMTMALGGTAYIAERMKLSRLFSWLRDFAIHYCIFPEPALKRFPASSSDRTLSLRYVSVYGWREDARREVQARFGVVAREGYGTTEMGGVLIMPNAATEKALGRSCGLPAPLRELRIVDEGGADVERGEIGELWVRGPCMSWGYHKRAQANADSYRGAWIRSGDLFRQDEDGYYYLVGRIKDMIGRGGENISAHEVEVALRELSGIEEAAVVAVPDPDRREEVKAYVLLAQGETRKSVTPEAIIAHCASRLAAFKLPRYITYVEDFPRTPSRKIAKKRLVSEVRDLRVGAWDRVDGCWR